jgi:hypothetical protein
MKAPLASGDSRIAPPAAALNARGRIDVPDDDVLASSIARAGGGDCEFEPLSRRRPSPEESVLQATSPGTFP